MIVKTCSVSEITPSMPKQLALNKDFITADEQSLLHIGTTPWQLKHAFEGVLALGGTGSGKSSGTARTLARAYLQAGMGGLVLCTKPHDADDWRNYAKETGRESSFIFFDDSEQERFNFLDYEMQCSSSPLKSSLNLTELFMKIGEAAQGSSGKKQQGENSFWDRSVKLLIRNTLDTLIAAYGRIRIQDVKRFIHTMPRKDDENRSGFAYQTLQLAYGQPVHPLDEAMKQTLHDYFMLSVAKMDDKTRSNIIATFESFVFPFDNGTLHNLFCTTTTIVPELTQHGAVIVIDLPVRTYYEQGIIAAHIWKYLFQRATERRDTRVNPRPVFLFVDEAQNFLNETDADFQSTARSSRACSVYLTQNIAGIFGKIGDEHRANALLGNLRTKIFHSNDEPTTNQWCADIIGKSMQYRQNWNSGTNQSQSQGTNQGQTMGDNWGRSYSEQGESRSMGMNGGLSRGSSWTGSQGSSQGYGVNETIDYDIQPAFFAHGLRTGGKANKHLVDAVIYHPARSDNFDNGRNWTLCTFQQS